MDGYFADYITIVLAHPDPKVLTLAANVLADFPERRLRSRRRTLARPECRNLAVAPGRIIGQAFRRKAGCTKTHRRDLKKKDVPRKQRACAAEEAGDIPQGAFPAAMRKRLPYEYSDPLRILGVWWDSILCFADHIKGVLGRAPVRHCIFARLAGITWGLGTGALEATRSALLVSLSGYALAAVGSGARGEGLRSLEVKLANISARRIVGAGRSARPAALHMTAGVLSVRIQYTEMRVIAG